MLRAYYGPSRTALADLRTRYGATVLWVRRRALAHEAAGPGDRWPARKLPFGRAARDAAATGPPAALALPATCRRWRSGAEEVYDLACVGTFTSSSPLRGATRRGSRASPQEEAP